MGRSIGERGRGYRETREGFWRHGACGPLGTTEMKTRKLFDVEIVRLCPSDPGREAREILGSIGADHFWREPGFLGADLSLDDAMRLNDIIGRAGGAGLVVPSEYREPLVSLDAARQVAAQRYQEIRVERGDIFGPLEDGREQSMWWRFFAENRPAQAEGREPGCIYIDVDKIDGHVKTQEDVSEYASWQRRG